MKVHQLSVTNPDEIIPALESFIDGYEPENIFNVIPITVAVPKKTHAFTLQQSQQPDVEYQFRFIVIYE